MTVTAVHKDPDTLTMSITSEFAAPPERVWQLWQDPRQLERWWGPPMAPATVKTHDLRAGGSVGYYMTMPDGARYHGYWNVVAAEPPHRLVVVDGFANDDGSPNTELPTTTMTVSIEPADAGVTRMSVQSRFASREAMEQVLAMGAEEGMIGAFSQIDAILAEVPAA